MVRILGNNLSNKKKMYIALTAIYGIGINTSKKTRTTVKQSWRCNSNINKYKECKYVVRYLPKFQKSIDDRLPKSKLQNINI